MDTKLRADIAESAVVTELLSRGHRVLKPVSDRLPYDIAIDVDGRLVRLQVKHAWYDAVKRMHMVDVRRTKTNRRRMVRDRYSMQDFDFAIVYIPEGRTFYVIPVDEFLRYASTLAIVESAKRQRPPKSTKYRERWNLLSMWAPDSETDRLIPVKFGEALAGNTEPSPERGRCRD